jgi:putative transcriptional regulator
MTISHHPPEQLLAAFAAGTLDAGEHLVVAVHVARCSRCKSLVRAVEELGGKALDQTEPASMPDGSFETAMAMIGAPSVRDREARGLIPRELEEDRLPPLLRSYQIGSRRWVAPGVSLHPIRLPKKGKSRAFLLRSGPGTRMIEHSHAGTELTCVLKGNFSHEGGRFGPGDFDFGDGTIDHQPIVGTEGPCVCLVAMTGDLKLNGFLGWLMGPFVRL